MESLILVSAIVVTLSLLIAIHRLNNNLARFISTEKTVYPGGQPLYFINVAGKWLTYIGGIAMSPLVITAIFISESSTQWVVPLALFGCLALLSATLLLIPTCVGQCITRKIRIKRIVLNACHIMAKKVLKLAGYKTLVLVAGIFLLALFVPFFADLLTFIVYLAGFFVAARLGLMDNLDEKKIDNGAPSHGGVYNYATGKVDSGIEFGGLYDD